MSAGRRHAGMRGACIALLGTSVASCTDLDELPEPRPTLLSPMFGVCIEALQPPDHFDLNREKPVDWDDGILVVDNRPFDLYIGLHPPVPARALDTTSIPVERFVRVAGTSNEAAGVLFAARVKDLPGPLYVSIKPKPAVPLARTTSIDEFATRLSFCVRPG